MPPVTVDGGGALAAQVLPLNAYPLAHPINVDWTVVVVVVLVALISAALVQTTGRVAPPEASLIAPVQLSR